MNRRPTAPGRVLGRGIAHFQHKPALDRGMAKVSEAETLEHLRQWVAEYSADRARRGIPPEGKRLPYGARGDELARRFSML